MKSIELTQKHKDKLLEMCKALFPMYLHWQFGNYKINSTDKLLFYDNDYDNELGYEIHWFEFCIIHLSDAISKIKDYPSDLIDRQEFRLSILHNIYTEHPVDFLYEEFKKIKNE